MNFYNSQFDNIREQIMNTNMVTERGRIYKARPVSMKISAEVNYISSINTHQLSKQDYRAANSEGLRNQIEQQHNSNPQNMGAAFDSIATEWTIKKQPKFSLQQDSNNKTCALIKNKSLLGSTYLKNRTYVYGQPIKSLLLPILKPIGLSRIPERPVVSSGHIPDMIPEVLQDKDSESSTIEYASSNGPIRSSLSTDISSQ